MMDGTAADRVEKLLRDHPGVPLTGRGGVQQSVGGSRGLLIGQGDRRVRLLIGDCRPQLFQANATSREDRDEVLGFFGTP